MDSTSLAITTAARYSKTNTARLKAMVEALSKIDNEKIVGDIVECGVWQGGNIILARKLSPNRVCWLYDTFSGMPKPQAVDVTRSGKRALDLYSKKISPGGKWASVSRHEVMKNLANLGLLHEDYLRFVEGKVEETLSQEQNVPEKIALLRLDTDWYSSTKVELEVLYPRLQSGGILIIDDYGHWVGARKAVDEYFWGKKIRLETIDYTAVQVVKE